MGDDEKGQTSAWYKVPTWDGSPATWRSFRREMAWWTSSLNIEDTKKFNLAARWLLRQSGSVRARGEEFLPEDLEYKKAVTAQDPDSGETYVIEDEDPLYGLNKLLKALESLNGKTELDRKGELRGTFYLELKRRPGERLAEFCTRFRTTVAEMKQEGIHLPAGELGWFLKSKLGLDPIRQQLLETALQGKESYDHVELEVLRLFKDLHTSDPLQRRVDTGSRPPLMQRMFGGGGGFSQRSYPSTSAPSVASSMGRSFRSSASSTSSRSSFRPHRPVSQPPHRTYVAEADEEDHMDGEDEEELQPDDGGGGQPSLEEVLQAEAEELANEIQQAEQEGLDGDLLNDLEAGVEQAAESLITMREARGKLAEVRKDRGYGKAGSGGSSPAKGQGKGGGAQARKQSGKFPCFDCLQNGHWAGDPQCPSPGAGLGRKKPQSGSPSRAPGGNGQQRQVKVVESLNTEHVVSQPDGGGEIHEVSMVSSSHRGVSLDMALNEFHKRPSEVHSTSEPSLAWDKRLVGALDSACNRTCTGTTWLSNYLVHLKKSPPEIQALIRHEPEHEVFRFGNGGTQVSQERWRLPTVVGGTLIVFWTSVVQVPSLGLLLGRDFLDAVGAVLNFARRALRCDHLDSSIIQLRQLTAGHFMLPLIPDEWKRPEALKWRRIGQDGVVEIQVSGSEWVRRRLVAKGIEPHNRIHEHLVTEQSAKAADIKFSGLDISNSTTVSESIQSKTDHIHNHSGIRDNNNVSDRVASPVQVTMQSADRNRATSTTSSSTRSSDRHGAVGNQVRFQGSRKVDEIRYAPRRQSRLAHTWSALVVAAAALPALSSLPISNSWDHRRLEASSGFDGAQWSISKTSSPSSSHQRCFHDGESAGVLPSSQSPWPSLELSGRSGVDRNDVGKDGKRSSNNNSKRSSQGSKGCSIGSSKGREQRRAGSGADWSSWWSSNSQERSPSSRSFSGSGANWKGDRGSIEGKGQAGRGLDQVRQRPKEVSIFSQIFRRVVRSSNNSKSPSRSSAADTSTIPRSVNVFEGRGRCDHGTSSSDDGRTRSTVSRHDEPGDDPHDEHCGPPDDRVQQDIGGKDARCGDATGGVLQFKGNSNDESSGLRRDDAAAGRIPEECQRSMAGATDRPPSAGRDEWSETSDWRVGQRVKPGQQQLISQAWAKHVADRKAVSTTAEQVRAAFEVEWKDEMKGFMNEIFAVNLALPGRSPFLSEIYTDAQRIVKVAKKRGHNVGPAMSLSTGWDFQLASHREEALKWIRKHKPYVVALAFPCSFWSPLQALNGPKDYDAAFEKAFTLLQFALDVAEEQAKAGRHYVLENPAGSRAWKIQVVKDWLQKMKTMMVKFDQCRYNLRGHTGELHMKPTFFATSAQAVVSEFLGKRCMRDHAHEQVIGGSRVTGPAGQYTSELACAMVRALENQLEWELRRGGTVSSHDVLAMEGDGDAVHEDDVHADHGELVQYRIDESGSDVDVGVEDPDKVQVSSKTMQAIKRLHEATGHRSTKRLARALVITGAPIEAVMAAKRLKCSICDEKRRAKPRRPMSIPIPKDVNDQVHIDLVVVQDIAETRYFVVHLTDFASRYQMAGVLQSKSSSEVIDFMKQHWLPLLGPPRVLVCDHGREFTSHEFEQFLASQGIYAFFTGIGAPWQNGIAERSGGSLKAILSAVVVSNSVTGMREMKNALGESVQAYNMDVNDSGFSPLQMVTGRQPRMQGDVLGGIQQRLSEHSLLSSEPSMARSLAMRETARLAMTRLHFSRGLRKAEISRSRSTTVTDVPQPGEIIYFYREQKYRGRQARRVLDLKRWHGPALMLAIEGSTNAFVSFRGQLHKCALEHIRRASSLEQISAGAWGDAIREIVEAALREQSDAVEVPAVKDQPVQKAGDVVIQQDDVGGVGDDLPPVAPAELVSAAAATSPVQSGRGSDGTYSSLFNSRKSSIDGLAPGVMAPGTPIPELIATVGRSNTLENAMVRAREVEDRGMKRQASVPTSDLELQSQGGVSQSSKPAGSQALSMMQETLELTREQLVEWSNGTSSQHPLVQIQALATLDRLDPESAAVVDHGSWDGRWQLPTKTEWKVKEALGLTWPCGRSDYEANAVQAARKEYRWHQLSPELKKQYALASLDGWKVWADNGSIEVLDEETSRRILQDLRARGEMAKVLTPRWVMTDKNDGLRTLQNNLPVKPSSRLVVPGYQDETAYGMRKDAPTCCRISQHILFTVVASRHCDGWRLFSADIKSAFMKGDKYQEGTRELYLQNVAGASDVPKIPIPSGCLAKVVKGVFGLADAPRRWYLRLHRALTERNWVRSPMDRACWFLWKPCGKELHGMVLSHVDDLLLGGDSTAQESLLDLGKELGFGSIDRDEFVYCGKRIKQRSDGTVVVNMEEYHANLHPIRVTSDRKKDLKAELLPGELKQLRALLGSLQWMVAQVRLDMSYPLSTLQGEKPTVGTMIRANQLLRTFKQTPAFGLTFRPMSLKDAGIMVVTDASLGNVKADGSVGDNPLERVYSQACYFVLWGDRSLMEGKPGQFSVLDARSHRLPRVCRSTFGAELLGTEEAFDVGQLARGYIASVLGYPLMAKDVSSSTDAVAMAVITDAKDVFDKSCSDTPSYGSQKSLAFTISWIRGMLAKPNTSMKWTSTENMFVDAGMKDMDPHHMQRIISSGQWCAKYTSDFIKQPNKTKKAKEVVQNDEVLGEPIACDDPLQPHLMTLSEACDGM